MRYGCEIRHRRSIRLTSFDYTRVGAYFLTICTYGRECILEEEALRSAVEDVWAAIPHHFSHTAVDEMVVMPNHVHGIVAIVQGWPPVGARHDAPLRPDPGWAPAWIPGSLGAIVLQFKSASSKRINELRGTPGGRVWQRNYYERVIRNESEMQRARQYIMDNPVKWDVDKNNPANWAVAQKAHP